MTSFNHYALGAVADFLHRVVAGLAPAEPGYRSILVRPRPGGGLTSASASLTTDLGRVAVAWRRVGESLHVAVSVPPGATARVELDGREPVTLSPGDHELVDTCRPASDDPERPKRWSPFDEIDAS
jgi:alpha-L-rhamnosidase